MSIKNFHIIFVVLATLLCFGVGGWAAMYTFKMKSSEYLAIGISSAFLGIVFIFYGQHFFKKLLSIK